MKLKSGSESLFCTPSPVGTSPIRGRSYKLKDSTSVAVGCTLFKILMCGSINISPLCSFILKEIQVRSTVIFIEKLE
ncbi:hypothetical protein BXY64_1727 [Marinifilum flexuosum]|uniref:Uncharacterized protein n=1 Tax=Marinifilum flexuosum TaxID=1117708 RepID=A0A419XAU2_9BACT|nr:hypothetical protein BXY64_1727 [Marinifilum flexuosum]